MARPKKADGDRSAPDPDAPVRYVGKMTRKQRALFKYFCERIGEDMEEIGVKWIMERLATEMGKRGWKVGE